MSAEGNSCPCPPVRELQRQMEKVNEKISEDRQELARMKQQLQSIEDRVMRVDKKIDGLGGRLEKRFCGMEDKLSALALRPAARWEEAVKTAIGVVITLLLSYVAVQLGLK